MGKRAGCLTVFGERSRARARSRSIDLEALGELNQHRDDAFEWYLAHLVSVCVNKLETQANVKYGC